MMIGRLYAPSRTKHFHQPSHPLSYPQALLRFASIWPTRDNIGAVSAKQWTCPQFLRTILKAPLRQLLNAEKEQAMLSKTCFAYAIMSGYALRAVSSGASQMENRQTTSPLMLTVHENMSAAATNATTLYDIPTTNQSSLGNGTQQESNRSSSLNDLPFDNDLAAQSTHILRCNSNSYGSYLNRHSCFDAWQNLGRLPDTVRWGPGAPDPSSPYRLPYRWSSGTSVRTR